jgi:hypothetical protein
VSKTETSARSIDDAARQSAIPTWVFVAAFALLLAVFIPVLSYLADSIQLARTGTKVEATVISNRAEGTGESTLFYTLVEYQTLKTERALPTAVRAELREEGAHELGSKILIQYAPDDYARIQAVFEPWEWQMSFGFLGIFALIFGFIGHNILRRVRGDVIYVRPSPTLEREYYVPTAEEDAQFDRNQAAGTPVIMGEVDGKWQKLTGADLEAAQKEFRQDSWIFLAFGIVAIVIGLGGLGFGLLRPSGFQWTDLILPVFALPFGAIFFYGGVLSMGDKQ